MKKVIAKIVKGLIASLALAFIFMPVDAKAIGEPSISFVTDYRNDSGLTYVLISNKGSLGDGVDAYNWTITENATDLLTGGSTLNFSETRKGITDRIYINTGKFELDHPNAVNITATCPKLGYTYTTTITLKNDKLINGDFHIVVTDSTCLYNGKINDTIDGYPMQLGPFARASIKAMLPPGYMPGAEGTLVFNYFRDYINKSGVVCYTIPEGYLTPGRTFKLATISEGGIINVYDDIDLNPTTITANVNFNGYAVVLCYSESQTAVLPGTAGITIPIYETAPLDPVSTSPQSYVPLPNYSFERKQQGPACQNIFIANTPAGYAITEQYSLKTYGSSNTYEKNGLVVLYPGSNYSDYKLITVDTNGYASVLNDLDQNPSTATFAVNFSGYACALAAR